MFLPDGAIRFRTGEPDFSSLKDQEYDWTRSVYSGACEQIPHDIPKPLGKHGQTTHYVDANLHHDLATGKAVPAVLHFLNQTPIDAYSKRHHLVSYHRVKEAIAAKYISFHWKDGNCNPADILNKRLEFPSVLIQFPPEMDENWVRYGLAKLGQISRLPNWQRMLFCAYTTQLLHSTGEVCWNIKDSYFIWFEFVC